VAGAAPKAGADAVPVAAAAPKLKGAVDAADDVGWPKLNDIVRGWSPVGAAVRGLSREGERADRCERREVVLRQVAVRVTRAEPCRRPPPTPLALSGNVGDTDRR
jgi:hypothetical protein